MKTINRIVSAFFFLAVCACSKLTVTHFQSNNLDVKHISVKVSQSEILQYALTNSIPGTKASDIKLSPITYKQDTVMYVANYPKGWEVLSAVRKASRVLMKSETGQLDIKEINNNPSLVEYFQLLTETLYNAMYDDSFDVPDYFNDTWLDGSFPGSGGPALLDSLYTSVMDSTIYNVVEDRSIGPLLSTHWGQTSPWNKSMPYMDNTLTAHCYCGCVPVASGQVLYYLHDRLCNYPPVYTSADCNAYIPSNADSLVLTWSDVNLYSPSYLNWNNMAKDSSYASGYDEVSALLLCLGVQFGARYYRTGTGANTSLAIGIFPYYYNIDCDYSDLRSDFSPFITACESEVYDEELPLLMSIAITDNTGAAISGHAVVIDGYRYSKMRVMYHYSYYDDEGNYVDERWQFGPVIESRYVTINWGWNGAFDSTPTSKYWFNIFNDWIVSTYNFSLKRYIVHNFHIE